MPETTQIPTALADALVAAAPPELAEQLCAAIDAGEPIGWQVITPDGEVVDSGPVSFAELTSEVLEQINQEA